MEDSRPTSSRSSDYACSSPTIIVERGTFELICNGSKRPRGHIPLPYSLNGQDSGTACYKSNSLLNNYIDLDFF
jgi:hypothetical protein